MADVENPRNSQISNSAMSGVSDEDNKPTESSGGFPLPMVAVSVFVAIATVAWVMSSHNDPGTPEQKQESTAAGKHDEGATEGEDKDDQAANQAAGGVCACGLVYVIGGCFCRDALPEWLYCGPCWPASPSKNGMQTVLATALEIKSELEWADLCQDDQIGTEIFGLEPWLSFGAVSDGAKQKCLADTLVTDKDAAGLENDENAPDTGKLKLGELTEGKVLKVTLASFKAAVKKFDSSETIGPEIASLADDQAIAAAFKATQDALFLMRQEKKHKLVLTPQFFLTWGPIRAIEFMSDFSGRMYESRKLFHQY